MWGDVETQGDMGTQETQGRRRGEMARGRKGTWGDGVGDGAGVVRGREETQREARGDGADAHGTGMGP